MPLIGSILRRTKTAMKDIKREKCWGEGCPAKAPRRRKIPPDREKPNWHPFPGARSHHPHPRPLPRPRLLFQASSERTRKRTRTRKTMTSKDRLAPQRLLDRIPE